MSLGYILQICFIKTLNAKKTKKTTQLCSCLYYVKCVCTPIFYFISPDPGKGFWKARSHAKLLLKVKISIGFGFSLTSSKS